MLPSWPAPLRATDHSIRSLGVKVPSGAITPAFRKTSLPTGATKRSGVSRTKVLPGGVVGVGGAPAGGATIGTAGVTLAAGNTGETIPGMAVAGSYGTGGINVGGGTIGGGV